MRKILIIIGTSLVAILFLLGACAPTPAPAPEKTPAPASARAPTPAPTSAEFEVISLDIKPTEVMAGETVGITAVVKNIGGSEGTYAVILTVDGVTAEVKEVAITPGSSKVVNFSLVEDTPGTYEIGIGEVTSSLTVKKELEINEVELKYDYGKVDRTHACRGWGYLVQFSPPATPFTITKVKIFGNLYGTGYENLTFDVQIWDKEQKIVHSASYPHTKFSISPGWLVIDITDVAIGGDFYIYVETYSPREGGVRIGYDTSVKNEHSYMTQRGMITENWTLYEDVTKEEVNWMIRVIGITK
jgi:hypothetical protein